MRPWGGGEIKKDRKGRFGVVSDSGYEVDGTSGVRCARISEIYCNFVFFCLYLPLMLQSVRLLPQPSLGYSVKK